MKKQYMLLIITTTITGLMAGLFFSWSVSVTPGIGKLGDREYLASFQAMNRAIINPVFMLCFLGAAVLLPICTFMHRTTNSFWFLLGASVFYVGGVAAVTFAANIPLNNALDRFNIDAASSEQMSAFRAQFENRWNTLNHIRSVANTIALVLAILACISKNNSSAN
jgi:uncharacterized membrane protein